MSEEIKIRAWDGKRMIHLSDLSIGLKKSKTVSPYAYFSVDTFGGHVRLGKHDIMLFAGITDKNNVEIYSGDIVNVTDSPNNPVIITYEDASFCIRKPDTYSFDAAVTIRDAMLQANLRGIEFECEIIGNIYENKLLK
jgi:uncharacterized phage protein (TIGR01671 family)